MKAATGLLLIGGGAFLLIALLGGQLKFPIGAVNILGSTLGGVLSYGPDSGQSVFNPQSGTTATGKKWQQPDSNGNCPKGLVPTMTPSGHRVCQQP